MTQITIPNTFIPSTTISSTEMNDNFQTVAQAIEDSFAIDGTDAMTGALRLIAGSAGDPALTFATDLNLGLYRSSADVLGVAVNGIEAARFESTGATITQADDGASAGPTFNLDRLSSSPAANDVLAQIQFTGRDSGAATVVYGAIDAVILDPVNGSEDGQLRLRARVADVNTVLASFSGAGNTITGPTTFNSDPAFEMTDDGAAAGPLVVLRRISASPAANDDIGRVDFYGRDSAGNDVRYAALEATIADPTNGSEDGLLRLVTRVADSPVPLLTLSASGILATQPGIGIGYGTGAGGTVTQNTSKSTSVTLNAITGQVVTNNESLSAGNGATFTMNNNMISAGDLVFTTHKTGGTSGAYAVNARSANGSAIMSIRNISGGSLGDAVTIGFAVFKSATS